MPVWLEEHVKTKTRGFIGSDGQFEVSEIAWHPPSRLSEAEREEATDLHQQMEASLELADSNLKTKWLATLGSLVAGNMPAIEVQTRLKAFSMVWDVPACLLTKEALRAAAARFKWFPSFAELDAFIQEREKPLREKTKRLRVIAYGSEYASKDKNVREILSAVARRMSVENDR